RRPQPYAPRTPRRRSPRTRRPCEDRAGRGAQWRARAGRTPSPPRAAADARRARSRRHLLPSSFGDLTAAAQVAQHDLLELDVVHLPACVVETAVRAHEQRRLSLRVTLVDDGVDA